MVIQPNMSPKIITEVWENTIGIFKKYNIPISDKTIELVADTNIINLLLIELNDSVGSSHATCIEGG